MSFWDCTQLRFFCCCMSIKTGISLIGFSDILAVVANAIFTASILTTEEYYLILCTTLPLLLFVRVPRIIAFFITVCDKRILYKRTCYYITRIITTILGFFISCGQVVLICVEAEDIFEWMDDAYIVAIIFTVTSLILTYIFEVYFIFVARQYRENLLFKLAKMRLTELQYLQSNPNNLTQQNLNLSRLSLNLPTGALVTPNKSLNRFDSSPVSKMHDELKVAKPAQSSNEVMNNISLLQVQIDYLKDQYQRQLRLEQLRQEDLARQELARSLSNFVPHSITPPAAARDVRQSIYNQNRDIDEEFNTRKKDSDMRLDRQGSRPNLIYNSYYDTRY